MSIEAVRGLDSLASTFAPAGAAPSGARPATGFSDLLHGLVENADKAQKQSDALVESVAKGEPTDVHQVVLALSQAAAQLEEAVLWNPAHADAFALLGEVRWAQDERAAAERAYRRYLELESDSRRRASAEARLRRITGQDAVASGSRLR